MNDRPTALDAAQLVRIEAVHRGFLYQHLYAVACFFKAERANVSEIIVESDEDVELLYADKRQYLQIKTRAETITRSDIGGALDRFDALRAEHVKGNRPGVPHFAIISNVAVSPTLQAELNGANWPKDVSIYWPSNPPSDPSLPEPWKDIPEATSACAIQASDLPFGTLLPETLVFKLAGVVLAAAAGLPPRSDHKFETAELPSLFEQLAIQLQDLPAPPICYRAQTNEPALVAESRIRNIVGFSGAGKTAWLAQAAIHQVGELAYFDVGDVPGNAIAIPLARELAGHFFGTKGSTLR